ncbi:hypothetical protein LZ31DRAFT_553192 [Colletotrichum somersetense]|nr:hypothetical protein LZ31DRAFT_553192 [Colletotrichum somersetense]
MPRLPAHQVQLLPPSPTERHRSVNSHARTVPHRRVICNDRRVFASTGGRPPRVSAACWALIICAGTRKSIGWDRPG